MAWREGRKAKAATALWKWKMQCKCHVITFSDSSLTAKRRVSVTVSPQKDGIALTCFTTMSSVATSQGQEHHFRLFFPILGGWPDTHGHSQARLGHRELLGTRRWLVAAWAAGRTWLREL